MRPASTATRLACSCRPTGRSLPPIVRARPCRRRRLAGSGEGFRRFRRAVAARGDERVAVGDVQLRQSLPMRGFRLDLVGLRERTSAAPAPRRSRAFPASAQSLRARARGRRGRRRDGRSIGRAWRAKAPRAVSKLRVPCRFATAMAVWKASSAGAELAGSRFSRIRRAPDAVRLRTRDSPGDRPSPALRRGRRERGRDRPPALRPRPAQSSIDPSNNRTFCSRSRSTPRRMSSSPSASGTALSSRPTLEKRADARHTWPDHAHARGGRVRMRSARARMVAAHQIEHGRMHFPNASVPTWVKPASRVCMRSTSEIARSTSPSGHETAAR